jgi:cardiolipin synthase
MTYHPCQFTRNVVHEPLLHLRCLGEGMLCKRLPCLLSKPGPLCPFREPMDPTELEEELEDVVGKPLQPAHVEIYPEGEPALAALKHLIDRATCSIDILMFIWENDCLGEELAALVAAKAGPNLRVRILIDGGGNLVFGKPPQGKHTDVNRVVCELASKPYVELYRNRNPFARFDHRKLVIVDGQVAWTGGRNFSHRSFFEQHDVSVTLTGPLVGELQKEFNRSWREQGGPAEPPWPRCCPPPPGPPLEGQVNAWTRLVLTHPPKRHLANAMYKAVDRAQHHVYLENVYFADCRLVFKLVQARRRGADVRVLMTVKSDSETINHSNRVTANRLLKAGVRVYLYPGMVHAKAASVDGCWAYLGTGNYDPLSLRHNRELGLAVGAGPLIEELEQRLFLTDFRPEWELCKPLPVNMKDYWCEFLANIFL